MSPNIDCKRLEFINLACQNRPKLNIEPTEQSNKSIVDCKMRLKRIFRINKSKTVVKYQ